MIKEHHIKRFWSKVAKSNSLNDCWLWISKSTFGTNRDYGKFTINGKSIGAHKFSWILENNKQVPKKHMVRHTCHNPKCVNPSHLIVGTHQDNMNDMVCNNRQAKGESNGNSKLSKEQVIQIRAQYIPKVVTIYNLANTYNVSPALINHIINRKIWKHI